MMITRSCLNLVRTLLFETALSIGAVSTFGADLPSSVVDTKWLAANVKTGDLRSLDVRDAITDYWLGHITGAVYINVEAVRLAHEGVPVMLLEADLFAEKLARMGISPSDTVVIYAETGDYKAPFLMWALDYIGHTSSGVLEGGYGKWESEGWPITQDYPEVVPTEYPLRSALNADVRTTLEDVRAAVESGDVALIDVRATPLYTGERGFRKRNGHVPGFRGHFWGDDLDVDGTWKPKDELVQVYADLGATPDNRVIVMCGQGLMSAHAYFTLKYVLGFPNVTNYDGGYHQWVSHDELPVSVGSE